MTDRHNLEISPYLRNAIRFIASGAGIHNMTKVFIWPIIIFNYCEIFSRNQQLSFPVLQLLLTILFFLTKNLTHHVIGRFDPHGGLIFIPEIKPIQNPSDFQPIPAGCIPQSRKEADLASYSYLKNLFEKFESKCTRAPERQIAREIDNRIKAKIRQNEILSNAELVNLVVMITAIEKGFLKHQKQKHLEEIKSELQTGLIC